MVPKFAVRKESDTPAIFVNESLGVSLLLGDRVRRII